MPGFFSRHREPVTGMDRREKFPPLANHSVFAGVLTRMLTKMSLFESRLLMLTMVVLLRRCNPQRLAVVLWESITDSRLLTRSVAPCQQMDFTSRVYAISLLFLS